MVSGFYRRISFKSLIYLAPKLCDPTDPSTSSASAACPLPPEPLSPLSLALTRSAELTVTVIFLPESKKTENAFKRRRFGGRCCIEFLGEAVSRDRAGRQSCSVISVVL
ncbi:hypothetical protein AOLI_G00183320 [Acnodon oligacanthus]